VEALKDDTTLIRTEVNRCQVILDGMSRRALNGASAAGPSPAATLVRLVRGRLADAQQARLRVEIASEVPVPVSGAPRIR
jgi:hypothetical protein